MDGFEEKINERRARDAQFLAGASERLSGMGARQGSHTNTANRAAAELERICRSWSIDVPNANDLPEDVEEVIRFFSDETGIMPRRVVLKGEWWKNGAAPLLCEDESGEPRALLPEKHGGYIFYENGEEVRVGKKNAERFSRECRCFYRPMENRPLSIRDFIMFLCKALNAADVIWLIVVSLAAGAAGLIMPAINEFIFDSVIPSGTAGALPGISVLVAGAVLVRAFCALARSRWVARVGNKAELLAQNAVWARLLSLPTAFFKRFSSGELAERADAVNTVCDVLSGQLIPTLLSIIFSFVYMFQIALIAPELLALSAAVIAAVIAVNILCAVLRIRYNSRNKTAEIKLSGLIFQLLNGLTKIKVSGAEARAFSKWAELYSTLKLIQPRVMTALGVVSGSVVFGGMILIYSKAYSSGMSASAFIAFSAAFSMFTASVMSFSDVTDHAAMLKPALDMLKPILEAEPETAGYKTRVEKLSGDIDIDRVRFRYNETMPYVIDGLELHIKRGEYIGITGSSGCGKSTLMRLLLGFEKPQSGSVYYDMQDLDGLDARSVRRRIGVVLQDGKLFAGDIFSNIAISAPWLTVDGAWEAAEKAGLADDIEQMPMGMFTMISEGGGGLSGGQQQRLLIARALASDPDIIMFDEATSALDNITQATVVNALEQMKCTRIVIAHRLSTVRNCSRIIYLDKGRIVEEGTYEELMSMRGRFAEMAERQLA